MLLFIYCNFRDVEIFMNPQELMESEVTKFNAQAHDSNAQLLLMKKWQNFVLERHF